MSYLVQKTLLDTVKIRSRSEIESDEFNDLILIEKAISELYETYKLTPTEYRLLDLIKNLGSVTSASKELGVPQYEVYRQFLKLSKRIADKLGGIFLNENYYAYVVDKYKLTQEEKERLEKILK